MFFCNIHNIVSAILTRPISARLVSWGGAECDIVDVQGSARLCLWAARQVRWSHSTYTLLLQRRPRHWLLQWASSSSRKAKTICVRVKGIGSRQCTMSGP